MKKLLCSIALVGAVACGGSSPTPAPRPNSQVPTNSAGAPSARAAVEQFFAAVKAQDLQAMSLVWGTAKGPARNNMERAELEKREVILQCYFQHDSYSITGESQGTGGQQVFQLRLVRGQQTRNTAAYTVAGPANRWYVQDLDMAAVRDFCTGGTNSR